MRLAMCGTGEQVQALCPQTSDSAGRRRGKRLGEGELAGGLDAVADHAARKVEPEMKNTPSQVRAQDHARHGIPVSSAGRGRGRHVGQRGNLIRESGNEGDTAPRFHRPSLLRRRALPGENGARSRGGGGGMRVSELRAPRAARECNTGRPRPNATHGVHISRSRSPVRNERRGAGRGESSYMRAHEKKRLATQDGVGGHLGRTRRGEARG